MRSVCFSYAKAMKITTHNVAHFSTPSQPDNSVAESPIQWLNLIVAGTTQWLKMNDIHKHPAKPKDRSHFQIQRQSFNSLNVIIKIQDDKIKRRITLKSLLSYTKLSRIKLILYQATLKQILTQIKAQYLDSKSTCWRLNFQNILDVYMSRTAQQLKSRSKHFAIT